MKKIVCVMLVLCFAISFVFAGGSGDRGAKKRNAGKIVIYTSMYEDVIKSVAFFLSGILRLIMRGVDIVIRFYVVNTNILNVHK